MTDHPDRPVHPDRSDRPSVPSGIVVVRGPIPQAWADQLNHLAVDLRTTRPQLITKAVALLLAHHGREVSSPGGAR